MKVSSALILEDMKIGYKMTLARLWKTYMNTVVKFAEKVPNSTAEQACEMGELCRFSQLRGLFEMWTYPWSLSWRWLTGGCHYYWNESESPLLYNSPNRSGIQWLNEQHKCLIRPSLDLFVWGCYFTHFVTPKRKQMLVPHNCKRKNEWHCLIRSSLDCLFRILVLHIFLSPKWKQKMLLYWYLTRYKQRFDFKQSILLETKTIKSNHTIGLLPDVHMKGNNKFSYLVVENVPSPLALGQCALCRPT